MNDAATEAKQEKILTALASIGRASGDAMRTNGIGRRDEPWNVPAQVPDLKRGAKFLLDAHKAEMEPTQVVRTFHYRPWDGAYCAAKVMEEQFGGSFAQPTPSFFGPIPPRTQAVATGTGKTAQVPWGDFQLAQLTIDPDQPTVITFSQDNHPRFGRVFQVSVLCPKKLEPAVLGFFALVEAECKVSSIYKGKAFVGVAESTDTEFIDLVGFDPSKIVYSGMVERQLDANVWTLIEDTERCVALGQSLKRAVCVYGPYGTGKTLFTKETARRAIANNWTFIQAKPGDDLGEAMQTARLYEPSVVVFEDIDTIAKADQDDQTISRLLDNMDGIGAKDTKVITLFTTNHPDKLHKGMLRPGRLDAMIEVAKLDDEGIAKLIRVTAGDRLSKEIDFAPVVIAMEGYLPSFVVEAVGVATKYAIARTKGTNAEILLDSEDLVFAAGELRPQWEKMEAAFDNVFVPNLGDKLAEIVRTEARESVARLISYDWLTSTGRELAVEIEQSASK